MSELEEAAMVVRSRMVENGVTSNAVEVDRLIAAAKREGYETGYGDGESSRSADYMAVLNEADLIPDDCEAEPTDVARLWRESLAAAKREGVREFLAQKPSGEWLAGEGESGAGVGEGVWHTDWPEESKALCWFDYSEQDTDDEELAVVRAKAKARAIANALNALAGEGTP